MSVQDLDPRGRSIDLGRDLTLRAPGLRGTVERLDDAVGDVRGDGARPSTIDALLDGASMRTLHRVALDAVETPAPTGAPDLRGPAGEEAIELAVPDLGTTVEQIVLAVDESGVATWHFPVDDSGRRAPGVHRGGGAPLVFRLPRPPALPRAGDDAVRGLGAMIGRRLLRVIGYRVLDPVLGALTSAAVGAWERRNRPSVLRRVDRSGAFSETGSDRWDVDDWTSFAAGPALLFVHGTFSRATTAFGALPSETFAALHDRYGGRVFAYDHPSVHVSPTSNADWLRASLRDAGVTPSVDIVCHSRGGLVARELASVPAEVGGIDVRSVVFVAAPNAGTALADPEHMVGMLDRYTNLAILLAPGVFGDVLEGVLTTVKVVGHAGLVALDGLAAMRPDGASLADLANRDRTAVSTFAIASDFEPGDAPVVSLVRAADGVVDVIFGRAANDLVVPTDGVGGPNGSAAFPIDPVRTLRLPASEGVHHGSYFEHPDVSRVLLEQLGG